MSLSRLSPHPYFAQKKKKQGILLPVQKCDTASDSMGEGQGKLIPNGHSVQDIEARWFRLHCFHLTFTIPVWVSILISI